MSQSDDIKREIMSCIEAGMSDKQAIYKHVADEIGVPRPTVRRVAGVLRRETATEMRALERSVLAAEIRSLERRRDEAAALLACLS